MNTTAIRQAIKLYKHPLEMSGLTSVHGTLPSGISDLLRLCASEKKMEAFTSERNIDPDMLYNVLTHFIEKVLFKEGASPYKILGLDKQSTYDSLESTSSTLNESSKDSLRLHYQLLMKIYHPDRNRSSSSAFYASKISKAYEQLKKPSSTSAESNENHLYPEPPKSFYQATQKAQNQINQTRNTFLMVSGMLVIALFIAAIYLNQPDSSGLIVRNNAIPTPEFSHSMLSPQTQEISSINSDLASYKNVINGQVSEKSMQSLLQKLEHAYEEGNVKQITPILANDPEMRQKSNKELSSRLATLFKITEERKMVLYDFSWANVAGKIKGKGQFLSRYLLAGDDIWQTRTGLASITAEIDNNNKIHIRTLDMNDHPTQQ